MKLVKKIRTFLLMESSKKFLCLEAFFYLGWARILKIIPFTKVAPSLGIPMEETSLSDHKTNKAILRNISEAIHIMSRYTFWESQCLVKAIAGMKMLQNRQIDSTLYLGTAKDEAGNLIAHAWLRSGSYYISGSEGMERFIVVGKFAKRVKQVR